MVNPRRLFMSPKPVIHRIVCAFLIVWMEYACLEIPLVFGLLKWGRAHAKQYNLLFTSNGIIPSKLMCSSSRICISVPPPSFLRNRVRRLVWCPPVLPINIHCFTVASSNAEPKSDTGIRFSVKKCAVLMNIHNTTYLCMFKDHHTLYDNIFIHFQVRCNFCHLRWTRKRIE